MIRKFKKGQNICEESANKRASHLTDDKLKLEFIDKNRKLDDNSFINKLVSSIRIIVQMVQETRPN